MTKVPQEILEKQPGYMRRSTDADGLKIHWPIIAWVLGMIVTALVSYNATSSSYDRRISVLEQQYQQMSNDIREIKVNVDYLVKRP